MANGKKVSLDRLDEKVNNIKETVTKIDIRLEKDYITKDEFDPIKKIVYGTVAILLTGVIVALLALVIRR
jgi:hypothetical protein